MTWQKLKLKRILRKSDMPIKEIPITNIKLSGQYFSMTLDVDDRVFFQNHSNKKVYELINEVKP